LPEFLRKNSIASPALSQKAERRVSHHDDEHLRQL
jgi:hypothetical protein